MLGLIKKDGIKRVVEENFEPQKDKEGYYNERVRAMETVGDYNVSFYVRYYCSRVEPGSLPDDLRPCIKLGGPHDAEIALIKLVN